MVGAELGIRPALLFRSPQGQRDLKVGQAARRARSLEETVYRRRFATRGSAHTDCGGRGRRSASPRRAASVERH